MANGDYANTAGFFVPVSAGAEWRLGYDEINRLADKAAWAAGADPWLTNTTFSQAGNWNNLSDPNGGAVGTNGGIRRFGPFLVALSWRANYTGTTITAGTAGGNIADLQVGMIWNPLFRPLAARYINASSGLAHADIRIDTDGKCWMTNLSSGATLVSGDLWQFDGMFPR